MTRLLLLGLIAALALGLARGAAPRATLEFPRQGEQVLLASTLLDMQVRLREVGELEPGRDFVIKFEQEGHAPLFYSRNGRFSLLDPPREPILGSGGIAHQKRLGHLGLGSYSIRLSTWTAEGEHGRVLDDSQPWVNFTVTSTAAAPVTDTRLTVTPAAGQRVACSDGGFHVALEVEHAPLGTLACFEHRRNATLFYHVDSPKCYQLQPPRPTQAADGAWLTFRVGDCGAGLHTFSYVLMDPQRQEALTRTQVVSYAMMTDPATELHEYVAPFVDMGGSFGKPGLLKALANAARAYEAPYVCETGFNAGYSTVAFLTANPRARVLSFDVHDHSVVSVAKAWVDRHFPGRHELVIGDSAQTVMQHHREHPDLKCDVVFVDGGHEYPAVLSDLQTLRFMATRATTVIADDTMVIEASDVLAGPKQAWDELEAAGQLETWERFHEDLDSGAEDWHTTGRYIG